tara:strand:- start:74 stop:1018 length:945 start_codon:yes stop_codon:yes gene_type:complete
MRSLTTTKPKLFLIGGYGWAGTSPLMYTLQRNAKYAHFGYTKHFRYLGLPEGAKEKKKVSYIYKKVCDGTWENYRSWDEGSHRMNLTVDLEPLRDFPRHHFTQLVTGNPTISKYMDYYHALHDHVISKGYKSVGDGHSGYQYWRKEFGQFYRILMSEFDVKFLMIVRDPVRRAFSDYLVMLQKRYDGRPRWDSPLPLAFSKVYDYISDLKHAYKIFGQDRVYITIMEELWEGDGKKELSSFLDHPITDLWKNLYCPDIGHRVKYDRDVPCQAYGQDLLELTTETYYSLKEKYQYVYDSWKNYYGSLPLYWGEKI